MAKTKAKRRRKHRGTQAGTVQQPEPSRARGSSRRGGKPHDRAASREEARKRRMERLDRPPTWRSSFNRAAIAAAIVAVVAVLALGNTLPEALILAVVMLVIYVPAGYGFDTLVYRIRQRRKGGGTGGGDRGSASSGGGARDREQPRGRSRGER